MNNYLGQCGPPQQRVQVGWLKQHTFISHSPGGWKSEMRVQAWWGPGSQMARFSLCPHMAENSNVFSSSFKDTISIMGAPPS